MPSAFKWLALASGFAALAATVFLTVECCILKTANAHSFYPSDCCSDRDCAPYPRNLVKENSAGFTLATGEFVDRKKIRFSPDGSFHLCRSETTQNILCFFVPNNGS